jgi:sulfide:quinone oxidoreductase
MPALPPILPHVVVLGGGFAGLETAFLVNHRMRGEVNITLVSDRSDFTFRPNLVYVPFGVDPSKLEIPLGEATARQAITFVHDRAVEVTPSAKRVLLSSGTELTYDKLVIATGAAMAPEEVPGLADHASSIWSAADQLGLRDVVHKITQDGVSGRNRRVLFLIAPNNKFSAVLYELALMLDAWLTKHNGRETIEITFATPEASYLEVFGAQMDELITDEFFPRGIRGFRAESAVEVLPGKVRFASGRVLEFDDLIAFPAHKAAVSYPSLPSDERGFLRCELGSRRVVGHPDIFAPGDCGDFPVKQAFLAFLQADTVAERVAAELRNQPCNAAFDPLSMWVLETLDKAIFAQVPLRLTGAPAFPVELDRSRESELRVGVSPMWRIGKKMLGVYIPMRFRAGEPFHAGTAWKLMDVGIEGMASILAH